MKRRHKSSSSFSDQKKFNEDETNDESNEEREREHLREQYSLMIDQLFYKRFSLKHHKATTIKKYDDVKLELLKLEERLNHVKSQIPTSHLKEWRLHTKRTHPMRPLVQQLSHNYGLQCCSQAFCKFYEILKRYPDLCELKSDPHENNELRSLHLCEAPGAFISALNVYLRLKKPDLKWSWRANTLNPHYEWTRTSDMFVDDELLTTTHSNWLFGDDNSGDIMQWDREYLNTLLENNEHYFNLITADGSLYCQDDPSNQECLTYPLLKKQVEISLFLLETGGSLVIKIYTMLREETSSLIARLLRSFDEVDLFKPSSSKPSNSEVYLICRGYKRDVMSTDIVMWTNILECSQLFVDYQIQAINFNVASFKHDRRKIAEIMKNDKKRAQENFKIQMETANFESITKKFWLKPCTASYYTPLYDENPWRLGKENDIIERFKCITYENAILSIEQMLLNECLNDQLSSNTVSEKPVGMCFECDACKWLKLMEQSNFHEEVVVFGSPSIANGVESANIQHSLFVDVLVIPLANATKTLLFDLCESSFLMANDGRDIPKEVMSLNQSHIEVNCDHMTQQQWIHLLIQIFQSRMSDSQTGITSLSIKCGKPVMILSRFAVSLIAYLNVLFSNVYLIASSDSNTTNCEVVRCQQPNRNFNNQKQFFNHLCRISTMLKDKQPRLLMQFIPIYQFKCTEFYTSIRQFNVTSITRLFSQAFANYQTNKQADITLVHDQM